MAHHGSEPSRTAAHHRSRNPRNDGPPPGPYRERLERRRHFSHAQLLQLWRKQDSTLIRFTECVAIELKPFGIAAFSISPGTVRTAMSEISLNSPDGKKWIPWFARIFEEGLNLPPERAAQLVVTLASGKADALSGRFIAPADDLDAMIASPAEIEQNNLYLLRLRKLGVETPNPILRFAEKIPQ